MPYDEHVRPVEIPPKPNDELLEQIAESYVGQPCKVRVPHRPIRTGNVIQMVTASDAHIKQGIQLQALRDEDKLLPPPPTPSVPLTMQQVLHQAPPRARSREIQLLWDCETRAGGK
jgi:hypothetical protein